MADTITLEFRADRVAVLIDEVLDLKLRSGMMETLLGALEARFGALENRSVGQAEWMTRMLAILVYLAQAQGSPAQQ